MLAGSCARSQGEPALTRPPIRPGSVPLPHVHLQPGEWTATGKVHMAVNSADEPAGTVLMRPWTFKRVCHTSCRTLFLRQTLYGPSETMVVAHDGFYTAAFPPVTVPCAHYPGEDAGTAQSYDTYTLRWAADHQRIIGVEQQRSVSRNCPGKQTDTWLATRNDPHAAVRAPGP